jgi:hypothetical protein
MKTLKRIIAMVLSIMIICTTNMQCLAAARAQTSTFTQTHTVNISGYGNVSNGSIRMVPAHHFLIL